MKDRVQTVPLGLLWSFFAQQLVAVREVLCAVGRGAQGARGVESLCFWSRPGFAILYP